jgi:Na+-driven multidrug efflux pump
MSSLLQECRKLHVSMLIPFLINSSDLTFMLATVVFMGHVGKGQLASGLVGIAFLNFSWYLFEGIIAAEDVILAHFTSEKDFSSVRYWLSLSLLAAIVLLVLATILNISSTWVIEHIFFIKYHISYRAVQFVYWTIPGMWCQGFYRVLQKYLHAKNIWFPSFACNLIGLFANIAGES